MQLCMADRPEKWVELGGIEGSSHPGLDFCVENRKSLRPPRYENSVASDGSTTPFAGLIGVLPDWSGAIVQNTYFVKSLVPHRFAR